MNSLAKALIARYQETDKPETMKRNDISRLKGHGEAVHPLMVLADRKGSESPRPLLSCRLMLQGKVGGPGGGGGGGGSVTFNELLLHLQLWLQICYEETTIPR